MSIEAGVLYVVATPLGNLGDISERAREVLGGAGLIAAEDTRVAQRLLSHLGVRTRCISLHEHNESARVPAILGVLGSGQAVAVISDAGTPLISDPGYRLVRAVREAGWRVSPIPGPSALIAALSASGLPTDRFVFEGFLPAKGGRRSTHLQALASETGTLVFYESSHRIAASLADMAAVFGPDRPAAVARELTKRFEEIVQASLGELVGWIDGDANRRRGEFVVMVGGAPSVPESTESRVAAATVIRVLAEALPARQAADLAASITGGARQALYREAQKIRRQRQDDEAQDAP
ncbi:16S rRNA (cytidine(1402)-2'-O)-methyltransferase [Acidihalobacter aeolianus]|uniref:Ribosomal RNA small subunit methyltransferase I n=1 Tax=Acidihalobacter aeolianus TaxID=2792603 RepID=A0A1D8KAF3_9GAMM|nr:16S rRNA (cytidine(1402)-2'-O)-methyltransferase [Acidihalobacter aeolianus]AOV17925.1 16S rRNA (cytidine(1402)-2'-O)-methyltransferase [Acidihalobacter aeolianus]